MRPFESANKLSVVNLPSALLHTVSAPIQERVGKQTETNWNLNYVTAS